MGSVALMGEGAQPPNWCPDPWAPGRLRYWDGRFPLPDGLCAYTSHCWGGGRWLPALRHAVESHCA